MTTTSAAIKSYDCPGGCLNSVCVSCIDYYDDADYDGYGNYSTKQCLLAGQAKSYQISQAGDCNDANSGVKPGTTETCSDNIDNNCDGNVDEGCAVAPPAESPVTDDSKETTTPTPPSSSIVPPPPNYRAADELEGGGSGCSITATGVHVSGPLWVGGSADFSDVCIGTTAVYDYSCDSTSYTHTTTTCDYGCNTATNQCNPAPWWAANGKTPEATESTQPASSPSTAPVNTDPCPGTQTQCGQVPGTTDQCTNCDSLGYIDHWCGLDGDRHAQPYRCNSNKVCHARGSVEIEDCGYGCWSLPTIEYTLCLSCRQLGTVTGLLEKSKCCSKSYRCSRMGIIFCREYKCT